MVRRQVAMNQARAVHERHRLQPLEQLASNLASPRINSTHDRHGESRHELFVENHHHVLQPVGHQTRPMAIVLPLRVVRDMVLL